MKASILCIVFLSCLSLYAAQNIAVIGTGYVGLVTGAGLASFGNKVVCCDIDQKKIERLNRGEIPIYEPGLSELVRQTVIQKKLSFSSDVDAAIGMSDVIFIAVGTPMSADGAADLSAVKSVAHTIGKQLDRYKVVCTKSTVPVGTGAMIERTIKESSDQPFDVVSNPEFLREGCAVDDFLHPDRVVLGLESDKAAAIMRDIYTPLLKEAVPFVQTNRVTAEAIKYAANAFLAIKVSYINEIANYCDAVGADALAVAQGIGLDSRIGKKFLQPGPGFGGSCFPKDSTALVYSAQEYGIDLKLVRDSLIINDVQRALVVHKVERMMGQSLQGKTIAILGLAFKAETDDVRCSPSIGVIRGLLRKGAIIKVYDPQGMPAMHQEYPTEIIYCDSAYQAIEHADALILMTEWAEFKSLDLEKVYSSMERPIIMDARNMFDTRQLLDLGFTFDTIGRSYVSPHRYRGQ